MRLFPHSHLVLSCSMRAQYLKTMDAICLHYKTIQCTWLMLTTQLHYKIQSLQVQISHRKKLTALWRGKKKKTKTCTSFHLQKHSILWTNYSKGGQQTNKKQEDEHWHQCMYMYMNTHTHTQTLHILLSHIHRMNVPCLTREILSPGLGGAGLTSAGNPLGHIPGGRGAGCRLFLGPAEAAWKQYTNFASMATLVCFQQLNISII